MARASKKTQLIEFKGTTLPIVSVTLRSLQLMPLARTASELFGDEEFFDGDAAVLELDQIDSAEHGETADWPGLRSLFSGHGLHLIGVRGGSEALREHAASAGLPSFAAFKRPTRDVEEPVRQETKPAAKATEPPATQPPQPEPPAPAPAVAAPTPPPPPAPATVPTLVIDRPLRSGQQVYARGGDLVVLAAVNAGAEVIADGSIHIYAPLRGRALAGASGAGNARIFSTRFEPELVSIAGVYRTFEAGVPDQLAGQPVQVQLLETPGENTSRLSIVELKTD